MDIESFRGSWALVTGASSGIGREYARALARSGLKLILVAQNRDELEKTAIEMRAIGAPDATFCAVDLSVTGAGRTVYAFAEESGAHVRFIVNAAAVGKWGRFELADSSFYENMLQVDIAALVTLTREFFPHLASFPSSVVVNVASGAAFQPVPYMNAYAAAKAFVLHFSLALFFEWEIYGIYVQTLVPGPTATNFDERAGAYASALKRRDSPEKVVAASLAHLAARTPLVDAAGGTYMQRFFAGVFPIRFVLKKVARMFQPPGE